MFSHFCQINWVSEWKRCWKMFLCHQDSKPRLLCLRFPGSPSSDSMIQNILSLRFYPGLFFWNTRRQTTLNDSPLTETCSDTACSDSSKPPSRFRKHPENRLSSSTDLHNILDTFTSFLTKIWLRVIQKPTSLLVNLRRLFVLQL